jgi:outer membrane lipoprotein carrier protein
MARKEHDMLKAIALVPLFLALLQGPVSAGQDAASVLEGIRKNYHRLPGLSVTYTREVITRTMSMLGDQVKGDVAFGDIYFKPPYAMRLEQKTPKPETLVTDGTTLWWYVPDKKRVYKYPAKEFGKELRLLSDIFRGLSRVEKSFKVAMAKDSGKTGYRIHLSPDPPWQEVDRITLTASPQYYIQQVDIRNRLGGLTRFKLGVLTVKQTFDKEFFRFSAPKGVQVVEQGKQ